MALDFFAGCVGGCAGVIVGHPLDTVKVMMQVNGGSVFGCVRSVIAKDSIAGLYRGVTSPMGGVAFVNAIVFGVYGGVQRRLPDADSLTTHAIAGATAGLLQSIVCSPVELAKTRMQLGLSNASGPLACLKDIARREGPRGIFRGLGVTALRDTPAFACYFVAYESLARTADGKPPGTARTLMAGGLAGMASWVITVPIDAVKSRMQADARYSSAYDCLKRSLKVEGSPFLFRGMSAALLRAFPTNAACFWTVNLCMHANFGCRIEAKVPAEDDGGHNAAHAYRSLLTFSGALGEHMICPSDIRDMHDDFKLGAVCRSLLIGAVAAG